MSQEVRSINIVGDEDSPPITRIKIVASLLIFWWQFIPRQF